jgi:outer membrane protein assembly factor BamB
MSSSRAARFRAGVLAWVVALALIGHFWARPDVSLAARTLGRSSEQTGVAPWPQFQHDPQHTGRGSFRAPTEPNVLWRVPWWARIFTSPVVGPDGAVYVAANGYLYAFNSDGSERWHAQTGSCQGTPALASTGAVYVTGTDPDGVSAALHAFTANGTPAWRFDVPGAVPRPFSTTVGPDGVIYFGVGAAGGGTGTLYAIEPNGTEKWRYATRLIEGSTPAVAPDGTVYVGSMDSGSGAALYAVGPDGSTRWQFTITGNINSSPLVAADGTIYFGSGNGKLYALTPSGAQKWNVDLGPVVFSSPALGADGTVYVGAGEALHAVRPDGTVAWRTACLPGGFANSSPAVSQDGRVLFQTGYTAANGAVSALLCSVDQATGMAQWSFPTQSGGSNNPLVSSPAIGGDGLVYVGSADGTLYALSEQAGDPPVPPRPPGVVASTAVMHPTSCGAVLAGALIVGVPNAAVSGDTPLAVEPRTVSGPSGPLQPIMGFAVNAGGGSGFQFRVPITLSVRYDEAALGNVTERTLGIYTVGAGGTREPLSCLVDPAANVVRCSTGHLSDFEVMGFTSSGRLTLPLGLRGTAP